MRLLAAFGYAAMLIFLGVVPSYAEKRVALVIGNGAYRNAPALPNPRNDAEDVSAALKRMGFETIIALNLDKQGMDETTLRFARAARDADVAMFYYSGHAIQFAGTNYLLPIDAKLDDENDLRLTTRVDEIVADLQQAKNLRVLVLDSCRDNPFAEQLRRSIGRTRAVSIERGLAHIDAPHGMIIAYATQSGQTAEDGIGHNSPYTAAFLRHIEAPEEIGTIFRQVTADVYKATDRRQLPELSLSLIGEFYLREQPQTQTVEAAQAWAALKDTMSLAVLEDFIRRYGDTFYGTLARARLDELKKSQATVTPAPTPQAAPSVQPSSRPPPNTTVATVAPPVTPTRPSEPTPKPAVTASPVQPGSPCRSDATIVSLSLRAPQPLSAGEECALKPKDEFKECRSCPTMVVVPSGTFRMDSPDHEALRNSDEGPQHDVTIKQPFAVGKFAITFDEWDACRADGGCSHRPEDEAWGRGTRPVINVNWNDAKTYLAWLNKKTGKLYRLLSEAEREYVTRAGTKTPFWVGKSISLDQANFGAADAYANATSGFRKQTVPVDSFPPNPWGLYQVHGNIREWTEDCYNGSYDGAPRDASPWLKGNCNQRVLRNGSWVNKSALLRSAFRGTITTNGVRSDTIGFRVARALLTP
jgi:formylglycine-generating enzyme required for sulfatase activity